MDEPFSAVDPSSAEELQTEILRLQSELHKTIVFVTHDIDEAVKLGDAVAVFGSGGTLQQYDTPARLLSNPANDFVANSSAPIVAIGCCSSSRRQPWAQTTIDGHRGRDRQPGARDDEMAAGRPPGRVAVRVD